MKESSWNECVECGSALQRTPNAEKAKSLLNIAHRRLKFLQSQRITEENGSYLFEGYYASLVEVVHALVIKNGFKVDNHVCLGYYLRDIIKKSEWFRDFDECRVRRNGLVYYGELLSLIIANRLIEKCLSLIRNIEVLL